MPDFAHPVGIDLRSSDVQLAVPDAAGAVKLIRLPAAAAASRDAVVYGEDAARILAVDPGAGWSRLLERVGDPVPCRIGSQTATAAELVARGIAATLRTVPTEVRVIAPGAWGAPHREALAAALVGAGLPAPRWVDELAAVAPDPAPDDAPVLLLTTAATLTHARVLRPDDTGWRVAAAAEVPFGADDVVEATFERAAARMAEAAGRPLTAEENRALADLCAPAAHRLPAASRLDVSLPELPGTRITRDEVDRLLVPRVTGAFAALPATLATLGVEAVPARVLLEGVGSRVPAVAATIGEALGRAVVVAPTDAAAVLASPAFSPPDAPTAVLAAVEETAVLPAPVPTVVAPSVAAPTVVISPVTAPTVVAPGAALLPPPPPPPPGRPDFPTSYGWQSVPARERRDRRGLKLAAAGGVLVLALAGVGILAGRGIQAAVQGALAPAPPAAIPVGSTMSPAATTPTLELGSASPSGTPTPTPAGTPTSTSAPAPQSTSQPAPQTTSTTKPPATTTSRTTTKPPATTTTRTTTTKPPVTSTTKPPTSTTTPPPTTTTAPTSTTTTTTTQTTPPPSTEPTSPPPSAGEASPAD